MQLQTEMNIRRRKNIMSTKAEYAISLHDQGYNCAQAVACTFCKEFGVDEQEMFRIAEGFGLGMGMMEMCGALSGMMMVIGLAGSVGDLKKGMPTKGSTYKQVKEQVQGRPPGFPTYSGENQRKKRFLPVPRVKGC